MKKPLSFEPFTIRLIKCRACLNEVGSLLHGATVSSYHITIGDPHTATGYLGICWPASALSLVSADLSPLFQITGCNALPQLLHYLPLGQLLCIRCRGSLHASSFLRPLEAA